MKPDDQGGALHKVAIEAGLLPQPEVPGIHVVPEEEAGRPDQYWVALPVDGRYGSDFNAELGKLVAGKGVYRFKGRLVTVTVDPLTNRAEIKEMAPHRFRTWVERRAAICCFRYHYSRGEGTTRQKQTMGVEHAQTCLASDEFCDLQPRLLRVNSVRLPILRRDGKMELLPEGYDEESGILTLPQPWEYDETMTAYEGLSIWENLIGEMPFQDARSRAVFFAALFSQYGYFLQPLDAKRINFLMHANSEGSGKTLLVEIILTVAWGVATIDNMPEDNGKLRDRLDTAVREAKTYLVLDDLEQTFLKSGLLNSFMTATWWGGRKFHSQEEFQEPKTPVVFMTANNLSVTPDIARRTLICDLFTGKADAQSRNVNRPIDADWIRSPAVHKQLCSALWAMLRAWRDGTGDGGGRKEGKRMMRGYESWSRIFGGIVLGLGLGDPCAPRTVEGTGNEEYSDMMAMITELAREVGKIGQFEFSELVQVCRELNCFGHIMALGHFNRVKDKDAPNGERKEFELSGSGNSRLGKLFEKYGGKSFTLADGREVVFDKRGKNRHRRYEILVTPPAEPAA